MPNRSLLVVALILGLTAAPAFISLAWAEASLEGSWKLTLGKKAPCDLVIAADGSVTPTEGCAVVARWKLTSSGVQLQTASGATYAVLKPKGDAFEGATIADQRSVTLTR
jgi:hypothetical protein